MCFSALTDGWQTFLYWNVLAFLVKSSHLFDVFLVWYIALGVVVIFTTLISSSPDMVCLCTCITFAFFHPVYFSVFQVFLKWFMPSVLHSDFIFLTCCLQTNLVSWVNYHPTYFPWLPFWTVRIFFLTFSFESWGLHSLTSLFWLLWISLWLDP